MVAEEMTGGGYGFEVPPPLLLVQSPGFGPPTLGFSPDSVMAAVGFGPNVPNDKGGAVELACVRPAPPSLRRQNASRFSWPPDPHQEWCYIALSPVELAEQCGRVLGRDTHPVEVAELFCSMEAGDSRAYAAYAARWRDELEELLFSSP